MDAHDCSGVITLSVGVNLMNFDFTVTGSAESSSACAAMLVAVIASLFMVLFNHQSAALDPIQCS